MRIKRLLSKKHRRAARRAAAADLALPPDPQGWQPGQIHKRGDTAEAHQARLVENILAENPGSEPLLQRLRDTVGRRPDTAHDLVPLLQLCALVPSGPGTLVDMAARPVQAEALRADKNWDVIPIGFPAFDCTRDLLPCEDGAQEGVVFRDDLACLARDPLFCLNEINRILKRKGFVVLTVPNAMSWLGIYRALRAPLGTPPPAPAGGGEDGAADIGARGYRVPEMAALLAAAGFAVETIVTRDAGLTPEYEPIPGFDPEHRGQTIFCRARKVGPPRMRHLRPFYPRDTAYVPPDTPVFTAKPAFSLLGGLHRFAAGLRPAPTPADPVPPGGTVATSVPVPPLSARETELLARLQAPPPQAEG